MKMSLLLLLTSGLTLGSAHAKELVGAYTPASEICPTPEEARAKMTVPEGYEVRCFAHEPMVQNPVAMTWDHRGRLWVVEAYEYPNGSEHPAPFGGEANDDQYHPLPQTKGAIPRDRVIILEDTDNDGVADKRTVFVEGLNLASAILCGDGGIYVGQQPHLIHFRDEDGDDKPEAWRVCLTGFGREDTHELVNSFTWGPDGWLYMTHGVFTNSKVRRPGQPEKEGFKFDAGIGRARPTSREKESAWEFEVFADGTSNPWGCDYDAAGNFFISACVIDHFFHMAPGGIYVRQGGAPENPYSYELIPSIVKHKHFRAAYAGVQIYQGGVYPADTHGHAFIGNIHDNAIHEEVLTPVGATFKCEPRRDFLRANDGWFRPVSTQTGPDGNLWIMDWCDKYPCYQNAKANPEGVDRDRGRIWRIVVSAGSEPPKRGTTKQEPLDLKKLTVEELVKNLEHPNNWMRRTARRMLVERPDEAAQREMETLLGQTTSPALALEALWSLHQTNQLEAAFLDQLTQHAAPAVRAWVARLSGERFHAADLHLATVSDSDVLKSSPAEKEAMAALTVDLQRLAKLEADPEMSVRSAVATAMRQGSAGDLTTNRPLASANKHWRPLVRMHNQMGNLVKTSASQHDRLLALQIWMVIEHGLATDAEETLLGVMALAPETQPLSHILSHKAMRRLCDTRDAKNLDLAIGFCQKIAAHDTLLAQALEGLVKGQEGGIIKPTLDASASLSEWRNHKDDKVKAQAQQLSVLWGDPEAIGQVVQTLLDGKQSVSARRAALQSLRQVKTEAAKAGYATLMKNKPEPALMIEAMRAAVDLGGDAFAQDALGLWKALNPQERIATAESLASRSVWSRALLEAMAAGTVARGDLPMTVARSLTNHSDPKIKARAGEVIGVWKDSSEDVKALIAAKKKAALTGEPNLADGKLMFQATCMVCHEFHGGGQKVGPDLIGSGRSNLDALLANVIDPNQIIGNGYENIIVATKDGRTLAGRMVEDTPSHVKLLGAGGAAQIVSRDQVASLTNTKQSLMPMGFGALPDEMFRDMIWYILAPPEEGPLTKEKKDLLTRGVEAAPATPGKPKTNWRAIDWESVSLWNPDWKVDAPDFERTPVKLADYYGRSNVLMFHPFEDRKKPASFERTLTPSPGKKRLRFAVAADDRGDWKLIVRVNGQIVQEMTVGHDKPRWKEVAVDLSAHVGKKITVKLEAQATDWHFEFAYWHEIKLGN
ncbi:PVC-type heme-binding CxxCH protein [Prosthecobacter dejongeii]|nr:PVC-type heme-binding CxxCH protein [Prosthecobacter dejongeii]